LGDYSNVEALAVTIAKNLTLDFIKRQRPTGELYETGEGYDNPAECIGEHDAAECIRRLIKTLPSLQQTIIRMKDIEGYEVGEIAEIIGTAQEAVRMNLSRARKKIREQFIEINKGRYEYR
jgi:RNA polymerase sigma-70 factor (ECF subfamily)